MQYQPLPKLTTTAHQGQDTKSHITLITEINNNNNNSNKLRLLQQQPLTTVVSSSSAATTGRKVMTNLSSTSSPPHHQQQHHYHHDSTVPSPPPPMLQQGQHHHPSASVIERVSCKMPRSSTASTTAGCYDMENMKPNLSPDTNSYLGKNFLFIYFYL